jgi:hypothetical protein
VSAEPRRSTTKPRIFGDSTCGTPVAVTPGMLFVLALSSIVVTGCVFYGTCMLTGAARI